MNKNLIVLLVLILITACGPTHKINGTVVVLDDEDKFVLGKNGAPTLDSEGNPILLDKEYKLDKVKNISRAKILFGDPESEVNCKNGGKALKYTVTSKGFSYNLFFAEGNTTTAKSFIPTSSQDTIVILFDRNGNYVAQNKKALDQCNV